MRSPLNYLDLLRDTRPINKLSFLELLQLIASKAKDTGGMTLKQIFVILSGKGYAALLILCSIPFCLPIQIPGFSTPFGIILGFIGVRIAFGKHLWWPSWILQKSLSSDQITTLVNAATGTIQKLQKVLHPRLLVLTQHPGCYRLHGMLVCLLAFFLALPLPIPFTNLLAAWPILFIGLGLLEDDGYAIMVGYFLAMICFTAFVLLFFLGAQHLMSDSGIL